MSADILSTLLGNYGFPIAAYAALFWYMIKMDSNHKSEIDRLSEAVENNTKVMVRITEKLSLDDEGVKQ